MSIFQRLCATEVTGNQRFLECKRWRLQSVRGRFAADYGTHRGVGCLPLMSFHSIASEGAKVVVQISATSTMEDSIQLALPQRDGGSSTTLF